jgi:hypothetical protein
MLLEMVLRFLKSNINKRHSNKILTRAKYFFRVPPNSFSLRATRGKMELEQQPSNAFHPATAELFVCVCVCVCVYNSMGLSSTREATSRTATQDLPSIFWNLKVHSLPLSQELHNCPYPEPDQFSPYLPVSSLKDPF